MKKRLKCLSLGLVSASIFYLSALQTVYASDEPYCREYTQTFTIAGKTQTGYGTACLQSDGSWKIVSQNEDIGQDETEESQEISKSEVYYVIENKDVYMVPRHVFFAPDFPHGPHPHHGPHR